jgi:putative ABC transport system permease protein
MLAMTLGLLRTETAGDLRILTAAGTLFTTRRTMAATTAGVLAFLGAILGTIISYVALFAFSSHSTNVSLTAVPVRRLFLIIVGMPVVGSVGGWIFAGREPKAIARQPFE